MKKIVLGCVSALTVLASGCATVIPPQPAGDKEPILVGKPINQRVDDSVRDIDAQLALLQQVQSGGKIGAYSVVTHNNELDARVGSDRTLPKAYAYGQAQGTNIVDRKIRKIEWQDNSLNLLAGKLAKAKGYNLVIKEGQMSDKNINFMAENVTLDEVIEKLKAQVAPFANIVVIEKNKTFNIFYQ